MQERYSIEVRNRQPQKVYKERYKHFIVANQEVTQALVPEVPGRKSELLNKHPRVVQGREKSRAVHTSSTQQKNIDYPLRVNHP